MKRGTDYLLVCVLLLVLVVAGGMFANVFTGHATISVKGGGYEYPIGFCAFNCGAGYSDRELGECGLMKDCVSDSFCGESENGYCIPNIREPFNLGWYKSYEENYRLLECGVNSMCFVPGELLAEGECYDSDSILLLAPHGDNLLLKGTTQLNGDQKTDECVDSNTLKEIFCSWSFLSSSWKIGSYETECENSCEEGRCLLGETSVQDSAFLLSPVDGREYEALDSDTFTENFICGTGTPDIVDEMILMMTIEGEWTEYARTSDKSFSGETYFFSFTIPTSGTLEKKSYNWSCVGVEKGFLGQDLNLYSAEENRTFRVFGIGNLDDDEDNDGVSDEEDNCVSDYNPNQIDSDEDGIGDACEGKGNLKLSAIDSSPEDDVLSLDVGESQTFYLEVENLGGEIVNISYDWYIGDSLEFSEVKEGTVSNSSFTYSFSISGDTFVGVNFYSGEEDWVAVWNVTVESDGSSGEGTTFSDYDGDGVEDDFDNCQIVPNADQLDSDGDGMGDACDSSYDSRDDDSEGLDSQRRDAGEDSSNVLWYFLIGFAVLLLVIVAIIIISVFVSKSKKFEDSSKEYGTRPVQNSSPPRGPPGNIYGSSRQPSRNFK